LSRASFFGLAKVPECSGACFPQALEDRLDQLLRKPDSLPLKVSQQRRDLDDEAAALIATRNV
jgi:hypothetical protein